MSKKKSQNHFKDLQDKRNAYLREIKAAKKKAGVDTTAGKAKPGKPQQVPYDPVKHKGYVLVYKKNAPCSTQWVPPTAVKGYRSAGWKTDAEVREIYAKWLRKHPEEAAKMKQDLTKDLGKINCPLCNGSGKLWVSCCDEDGCGCVHLPVVNDCTVCDGTGKVTADVAELLISDDLVAARNEQIELEELMADKDVEQ